MEDLDLSEISEQTIETSHVYDVHLGETVVPYATLPPLKAVLPVRQTEDRIPTDSNGAGGIRLGGLDRRMRERWQTVSGHLGREQGAGESAQSYWDSWTIFTNFHRSLTWINDPSE